MKLFTFIILSILLFSNLFSQNNILPGKFSNEPWDMFWLIAPTSGNPPTQQSGRIVTFNLQEFTTISSATLEYDYFDGDFLNGGGVSYTSFKVLIDGQTIDEITGASNTSFLHSMVDVTNYVQGKYALPVVFEILPTGQDAVVIARVYLEIQGTNAIDIEVNKKLNSFELKQNYPNPFNPSTTFEYNLNKTSDVKLKIYNALGQQIKSLVNERQSPDNYKIIWDGTDNTGSKVASGNYYYRLVVNNETKTNRLILVK